jgi:hypothetical protein
MATTTNYGWTTPDDTALVKDGAAAIRTLGSSVDTTTKALNPSTTLGDIEYRSSTANTNTRLGIGSTGDVLTVTGGVPVWAAPGGAGANWSLLNAGGTTLTGAQTITVSGISAKDKILVLVGSASSANAESLISVRFNTDTGSNYTAFGAQFVEGGGSYSVDLFRRYTQTALDAVPLGRISTSASAQVSGFLRIDGCNAAGVKAYTAGGMGSTEGGAGQQGFNIGGVYNSATTISSISIFSSTGNFDGGTVYVYTSA